jgi:hypothetical protein
MWSLKEKPYNDWESKQGGTSPRNSYKDMDILYNRDESKATSTSWAI